MNGWRGTTAFPGVYGPQFRKVKLTDPNRRGLLGQGSILAMTSVATRTSPVFRGKYVLSTFLNTPPPPPPPNVPDARRKQQGASTAAEDGSRAAGIAPQEPALRGLPSRDRSRWVSRSRTSIPWGNGVTPAPMARRSTWRVRSRTDRRSTVRWRCGEAILSRPDAFATVVTEKMLTYALGRGLEPERHAGGSADREEGRTKRLPAVLRCHGNYRKRTVPDADQAGTGGTTPRGRLNRH